MNEQQKEIEEFIGIIKEDLMEIYNITSKQANSLIENFKLRGLIDKHGELVAHYPSQELAKMAFEKSKVGKSGMTQQELIDYVSYIAYYMTVDYQISPKEAFNLIINECNFFEMAVETEGSILHYAPKYFSREMYEAHKERKNL